jgi:hypothetical protein
MTFDKLDRRFIKNIQQPDFNSEQDEGIDLEKLDLTKLPWVTGHVEKNRYGDDEVVYRAEQIVCYGEKKLPLRAQKNEKYTIDRMTGETVLSSLDYLVIIGEKSETIEGEIVINFVSDSDHSTNGQVETSIIRHKEKEAEPVLPQNAGITLYKQMLQTLQQLANEKAIPLQHRVTRVLSFRKDNPLSKEQWYAKFVPILEHYGYEPKNPGHNNGKYEKTYQPQ